MGARQIDRKRIVAWVSVTWWVSLWLVSVAVLVFLVLVAVLELES